MCSSEKYYLSFSRSEDKFCIKDKTLRELEQRHQDEKNFMPMVKAHVRHILRQKTQYYSQYFFQEFFPRMNRWNGSEMEIREGEYWFLQTAKYWLPSLDSKYLKVVEVGLNDNKQIVTITVSVPLHLAAPQLYILPTKRYLLVKWNTRGEVLKAAITGSKDMISVEPQTTTKIDLNWVVDNKSFLNPTFTEEKQLC